MRRRDYDKHLVIRCTAEERARWKALAELEDRKRNAGKSYYHRREEGLSLLVRELLEARAKAQPAAALKALEADMAKREREYRDAHARELAGLEGRTDTGRGRGLGTNTGAREGTSVRGRRRRARAAAPVTTAHQVGR